MKTGGGGVRRSSITPMNAPPPRLFLLCLVALVAAASAILAGVATPAPAASVTDRDQLENCQPAPRSWLPPLSSYQAAIGRDCLLRDSLDLPAGHYYRAVSLSTTVDANGRITSHRQLIELIDPASSWAEQTYYAQNAPVGSTLAPTVDGARQRTIYVVDENGTPVHGPVFEQMEPDWWDHPEFSELRVAGLRLDDHGKALWVSGRLPALCRSCWRQVGLGLYPDEHEVMRSFKSRAGYINFRLRINPKFVRPERIFRLTTDAMPPAAVLDAHGHRRWLEGQAIKTDTRISVRRTASGLRGVALRPRSTDAHIALDLSDRPEIAVLETTAHLSGCSHSRPECRASNSGEALVLDPAIKREGDDFVLESSWFRGLLPGEGADEILCVSYGRQPQDRQCFDITARRYGRGPVQQEVVQLSPPWAAPEAAAKD